ncbi:MAG: tetratricopeptide repeat protein [Kofleriaceae bacterium]|nr:tetratricopeptide repeat protein [Kofleriaceae bacterium]
MVRRVAWILALTAACHGTPTPVSIAPLPADAYAHYLAGKLAMYRDDAEAASRELSVAAAAAPDQPMITVELARALAKSKQDLAARDVLAKARVKWPHHAQVWLASGEVLERGSDKLPELRKQALDAYRRAIKLESTDERGYIGLARVQLAAGDPKGAEKTLRSLVAKVPDSVDGHYRLAQRLDANGDREAAVKELRAVLEWEPDHLDARMDLARTLRRQGKLAEAVAQTRSAFDRAGQPMDIAEELYWVICEADDRQGAIDLLTLLDDDRSDVDALARVAQLQRGLGRTPEARVVADHIKALDADESVISLAETDLAEGLTDAAIAKASSVRESSERYLEARAVVVNAHLAARQPAKALAVLRPLRAAHPDDLALAFAEALAHADAGDAAAARAIGDKLTGEAIVIAWLRARIVERLGDSAGALKLLEPALKSSPDHVGALNLAGYLLADRKERLDDAERYLARARDLQPGDPAILDSWGWLLYQRGRSRDAVRALDRAYRFAPRETEILVHLAAAWAADGAPGHARELLDRAAAQKPAPDVMRRIDALRQTLR